MKAEEGFKSGGEREDDVAAVRTRPQWEVGYQAAAIKKQLLVKCITLPREFLKGFLHLVALAASFPPLPLHPINKNSWK